MKLEPCFETNLILFDLPLALSSGHNTCEKVVVVKIFHNSPICSHVIEIEPELDSCVGGDESDGFGNTGSSSTNDLF